MTKSNRSRALKTAVGLLLAGTVTANAQDVVIWGGFPELTGYYERVAESLSGKYPDLNVIVEPIGLRDHEKRVALGLSSGLDDATILELIGSTANRYIVNDLIQPAPKGVSTFVNDDSNFEAFFQETAKVNGKVYGVPVFRGQGALFYNTDMLAAAGLEGPPLLIGVTFESEFLPQVPNEEHDIPVDASVTELSVHWFNTPD
mgnify:CR=1 FL=1